VTRRYELTLLLACAALVACGDSVGGGLPNWSDGFEDGGLAPPEDMVFHDDGGVPTNVPIGDSFAVTIPPELKYPMKVGRLDNLAEPCALEPDAKEKDITCIIDMDELDLWVLGLAFDVIVPEGMCDFLYYYSYIYANLPFGNGPTEVSWTVDDMGVRTNEVNVVDGMPTCEFDHRVTLGSKAPNCCGGAYLQRVTDAETGVVTTTRGDWGGLPSTCFDGAGFLDKEAKLDDDGWPLDTYVHVHRDPHLERKRYYGPLTYNPTNIPLANFFDPAEHDGTAPAGMLAARAQYYDFYCEDDAKEEIAHIRLMVREWNEEAEFDKEAGDPDTEGTEPGWDTPLNDREDWRDLTPGNQDLPALLVKRP